MRASVLGLVLLSCAAAGCVSRVGGPNLRPSWIPVENGEWVETLIEPRYQLHLWRYRAGGLGVERVRRGRARRSQVATPMPDRAWTSRVLKRDSLPLTYAIVGDSGWRARIDGMFVSTWETERLRPSTAARVLTLGAATTEETLRWAARSSRQRLTITAPGIPDSLGETWTVAFGRDSVALDEDPIRSLRLERGGRRLQLRPLAPGGERSADDDLGSLGELLARSLTASGWMIIDGKRVLAVVQTRGHGLWGGNDVRAWFPSTISAHERRARLAVVFAILNADGAGMFER